MRNKTAIIIVGPTAVGKTAAAIQLAQLLQTKIISADSRQCFRELNIGVAKPSGEELKSAEHFFISSHSIHEEVNAALFEQLSLQWANEVFKDNDTVIMVGGTGLYIKAFCDGLDEMPAVDAAIREDIRRQYEHKGMVWMQEEIKKKDPGFYFSGEVQNPQRLMRALEIKMSTGRSILHYRQRQKKARSFNIIKIGLQLPKEALHTNIDQRTDEMIANGLVEEARSLMACKNLNALRTVGYREMFEYLNLKMSLSEAIARIKRNTR
ncbi:MAG: tRNA (adenosine(37)-N6)-dimethylallyltransferase MiaA, partial [Bacteroidetes bacterium]|nr:tRNA (adenosine(37)-N6)-dimethylallyltransferase MiaA [Bacteroidota bacterium]